MVITKICVKDLSRPRSFHLDESVTTMTTNIDSILNDDSIEMIVEVMGGTDLAKYIVETAISKNKSVVTANKALLAEHLDELNELLHNHPRAGLGYEAAVCGGIPIIHTLQSSCYIGDVIHQVQGICNGTTNYMLCKMEQGLEFEAVLREAQELGYAESDATADVEGYDVRAKICLLAKLAFGVTVPPNSVPCSGISRLTSVDFEYAKLLHCTIKLLGTAQRLHCSREWDGPLCVHVSPVMMPTSHALANVSSNGNAVAITSANMGTCSYMGPGAGRFPTANSIAADMSRLASSISAGTYPPPPFPVMPQEQQQQASSSTPFSLSTTTLELDHDFISAFYIRIPYADGLGIIKRVGELCEEYEISIHSVLQNPIRDRMSADFCITTEDDCRKSQVEGLCAAMSEEPFCRAQCLWMPLLLA